MVAAVSNLTVYFGDNLPVLAGLPPASVDLVYIDPPFNTGRVQKRTQIAVVHDETLGDRTGFQGKRYRTIRLGTKEYVDVFDDYLAFLEPRLEQARRVLKRDGSLFFHIDYREAHYCKVLLDLVFGRESFMNEIIWAYDYGGRTKSRWPAKHDTILWYARDPGDYQFHLEECDRIPYMAPGLVGAEKAAGGKTPTDTWWHTIVSPSGREKTGYPTQKPRGRPRSDRQGAFALRRSAARFLRGQRDVRRGGRRARPGLHPGRRQPRGPEGHGTAVRRPGGGVDRLAARRGGFGHGASVAVARTGPRGGRALNAAPFPQSTVADAGTNRPRVTRVCSRAPASATGPGYSGSPSSGLTSECLRR